MDDRERAASHSRSRYRYGRGEGFGQQATDAQDLERFGRAYEAQRWQGDAPGSPLSFDVAREPRPAGWSSAVLGLVLFVVLLAAAIGLAMLLNGTR